VAAFANWTLQVDVFTHVMVPIHMVVSEAISFRLRADRLDTSFTRGRERMSQQAMWRSAQAIKLLAARVGLVSRFCLRLFQSPCASW
jgi:hypothetical protein